MKLEQGMKPFPWRCPECSAREVRPVAVHYTAQVKHDGRLHEVEVPELIVPTCSKCGEQVFCSDTDAQISSALRGHLGLMQPEEIRSRRERLDLTQRRLAQTLGIAPETICRWESGLLIQSRAMNTLLQLYFEFPGVPSFLEARTVGGGQRK